MSRRLAALVALLLLSCWSCGEGDDGGGAVAAPAAGGVEATAGAEAEADPLVAPDGANEAYSGDALVDETFRVLRDLIQLEIDDDDRDAIVARLMKVVDAEEIGLPERRIAAVRNIVDEMLARVRRFRPTDGRAGEVTGQQKQLVIGRARDFASGLRSTILLETASDFAPISHAGSMMMAPELSTLDVPEGYRRLSWNVLGGYAWRDDMEIPKDVLALDGEKVAIAGFMMSLGAFEDAHEFLLVESAWTCCFGLAPDVNQAIEVVLPAEQRGVAIITLPVLVVGTLRVAKQVEEGFVVGVYRILADDVTEAN